MDKFIELKKLRKCARCGKDHNFSILFKKFKIPINEWTHWGMCPNTKEPILLKLVDNKEVILQKNEKNNNKKIG